MSTTNYVTVTNNAIEESGADLATFDTGGADWTSNTNTLMNRMKRYVARAWKDIQQDAFDWGFMEEQAVVNINPGVMFYTDGSPITSFNALENTSVDIFDQDGSTAVSAVPFGMITDLTGISTDTKPFGYFDVVTTASTPITWSLKPGAEYFGQLATVAFSSYINILFDGLSSTVNNLSQIMFSFATPTLVKLKTNGHTYVMGLGTAGTVGTAEAFNLYMTASDFSVLSTDLGGHHPISIVNYFDASIVYYSTNYTSIPSVTGPLTPPVNPTNATGGVKAFIHGWKSFNFSEETGIDDFQESIKEIDQKSFRTIDYFKAPATGEVPVEYVPWEAFSRLYDISSAPSGIPRIITRDNTNRFKLYPHPYYIFTLKFDYTRTPQVITAYDDVFKGLDEDYVDIVMWKALVYYGEFDEQPSVATRATKNYKNYLTRLEQLYRQKFHFSPKRLF